MFRPAGAKVALFLTTVALTFSPLLFVGAGPSLALPVLQIFWLAGLAQAFGVQVTDGPGVDAFNLIPPSATGYILIAAGLGISLAAHYALACLVVTKIFRRG